MLVFYFFGLIQIFFGYKSLRGGFDFLNYFRESLAKPESEYMPPAAVILPCRGIDQDLEQNLKSILAQDYLDFEVIFVVDDPADDSVEVIKRVISGSARSARIVAAGKAKACGQKVHNLQAGVRETSLQAEVFVFADSDARPARDWLRHLTAPLKGGGVGCSTGYRWFIQNSGGISTHLRSVWNASVASALGPDRKSNFCWGGSTAILRKTFEELGIAKKWEGVVSDDFALTNAIQEKGLGIEFVPQCLTASVEDCSFRELLEFTTRQMKITRVYSNRLWIVSFISAFLFSAVFWGGVVILFLTDGIHFWLTLFVLTIILVFGTGKAALRLMAVRLVLVRYARELSSQYKWQLSVWPITPMLFVYNNIKALLSRKIVWRGIEYQLESSRKTVILENNG